MNPGILVISIFEATLHSPPAESAAYSVMRPVQRLSAFGAQHGQRGFFAHERSAWQRWYEVFASVAGQARRELVDVRDEADANEELRLSAPR
jgi:hypothetical protein